MSISSGSFSKTRIKVMNAGNRDGWRTVDLLLCDLCASYVHESLMQLHVEWHVKLDRVAEAVEQAQPSVFATFLNGLRQESDGATTDRQH